MGNLGSKVNVRLGKPLDDFITLFLFFAAPHGFRAAGISPRIRFILGGDGMYIYIDIDTCVFVSVCFVVFKNILFFFIHVYTNISLLNFYTYTYANTYTTLLSHIKWKICINKTKTKTLKTQTYLVNIQLFIVHYLVIT